jgi:hypothetical protein
MAVTRDPNTHIGAEVNDESQLVVRAINESEIEHASGKLGSAFCWFSGEHSQEPTDAMLYVKNTGDIPLILDRASFNGANAVCEWSVRIGAEVTTAVGTTVTGVNLNEEFSTKLADATAFTEETAVTAGSLVDHLKTGIDETLQHKLDGIILGKNHYVQIYQDTDVTRGSVALLGHFENPS